MQTPTIEQRIAEIAREAGLSYMCETWPRANLRFDKFHRDRDGVVKADDGSTLPALLYVQPVSGGLNFTSTGFLKDSPQTLLAFADEMPLDFTGEQAQTIAERLKGIAADFVARMNRSGYFEQIEGRVPYTVSFDRLDANLCIFTITPEVVEAVGECVE